MVLGNKKATNSNTRVEKETVDVNSNKKDSDSGNVNPRVQPSTDAVQPNLNPKPVQLSAAKKTADIFKAVSDTLNSQTSASKPATVATTNVGNAKSGDTLVKNAASLPVTPSATPKQSISLLVGSMKKANAWSEIASGSSLNVPHVARIIWLASKGKWSALDQLLDKLFLDEAPKIDLNIDPEILGVCSTNVQVLGVLISASSLVISIGLRRDE
eukprot:gene4802-5429_t